ncbi:MAG: hypothetical protein HY690_03015 [Chloroflexi bacterium]|nr:hypothetical protein [Chloroflexota bacterium]
MVQPRPLWQRRLFGPLILIALGVLLLLTNLGVVSWDIWRSLWRFWPVVLILLGLELLLSGRASWGAALVAFLVLLVFGAIAGAASAIPAWLDRPRDAAPAGATTGLEQPLEGATEAEVQVHFGAGQLEIGAGAAEGMLAQGVVEGQDPVNLSKSYRKSYRVRNGVGRLDLQLARVGGLDWLFGGRSLPNHLSLQLSSGVPIRRLEVHAGAAQAQLDLSELQVNSLDFDAGASKASLKLPARGTVTAAVKAGASSLVVEIPEGVAARIRAEGGASSFNLDTQRFQPVGRGEGIPGLAMQQEYRTPDFDTARDRVDLRISSGATSVEIR